MLEHIDKSVAFGISLFNYFFECESYCAKQIVDIVF